MFHQHLVPWIVARVRKKCFAHSHDRPAARPLLLDSTQYDLRHAAISMYFTIYSSTGLPLCRASHERTIRPPAENAFHVYVDPGRGPPAWSGFPVVYKMASRMVGPPVMLTSVLLLGLLLCRASHERTIRPPAENGFHVYVDPGRGPPAWSGFPVVYKTASRMVGPPGMLTSVLLLGLLLCRASHERTIRPPAENAFHVYVDPGRGPPALSGFPVVYNTASRMVGPPGILTFILLSGLPLCRASHVRTIRPRAPLWPFYCTPAFPCSPFPSHDLLFCPLTSPHLPSPHLTSPHPPHFTLSKDME